MSHLAKSQENAEHQIQINYYKNLTFIKSHIQDSKLKLHLLWIQPTCQISKMIFGGKQTLLISEDSTSIKQREKMIFQPCRRDTKRRNKNIIHALPLTSFFCRHCNMSHKHHKWSFCSINSVNIYPKCSFIWRVWSRKTLVPTWLQNISNVTCKLCQNISNYFCNTTLGIS